MGARKDRAHASWCDAVAAASELEADQQSDLEALAGLHERMELLTGNQFDHPWPPTDQRGEHWDPLTMTEWSLEAHGDPDAGYKELASYGIRAYGRNSANDYPIITEYAGNPAAWGFDHDTGTVAPSEFYRTMSGYGDLKCPDPDGYLDRSADFLKRCSDSEIKALTWYTGNGYEEINAEYCGRPNLGGDYYVPHMTTLMDRARTENVIREPITVTRGTTGLADWDHVDDYVEAAFPIGSRVESVGIMSTTYEPDIVNEFTCASEGRPAMVYAIRTSEGLAVGKHGLTREHEVVVGDNARMRVVDYAEKGIGGHPTVYLVSEDIVAAHQYAADQRKQ